MEQHIRILGIVTIIYYGLQALVVLVILPLFWGISLLADDPAASGIMGSIGAFITTVILILTVPGIIGGIGLLYRKSWARLLVLVFNALHLLSFPLGTALGIYSFWVLLNDETIAILESE